MKTLLVVAFFALAGAVTAVYADTPLVNCCPTCTVKCP